MSSTESGDPISVPMIASASTDPTQRLCIVCPCFQEEEGIQAFYVRLKRVLEQDCAEFAHEIILVDDGSIDGTLDRLQQIASQDDSVLVYSLTRNHGHQIALSAGLDVADGDAVVLMDSDLQHPPELIPDLIAKWRAGHDVVLAVRRQTEDATLFKRVSSDAFYSFFNLLSDVKLTPGAADFCLLGRQAHQALCQMPERRRFLRGMIAWLGFKTARVEYSAPPRFAGQSSYSLRRMLALALDATFSFSTRPIRLATKAGAACVFAGIAYVGYVLARYLLIGDLVPGWASIVGTVVLMGGLQLLSIGMIGEYLAQVFEEVKGRPKYLFKQTPARAVRSMQPEPPVWSVGPSGQLAPVEMAGDARCA